MLVDKNVRLMWSKYDTVYNLRGVFYIAFSKCKALLALKLMLEDNVHMFL